MSMSTEPTELRVILAPIGGGQLMLPGSVVAEVVELADLRPVKGGPAWIKGEMDWQDWRVPVISFGMLGGTAEVEAPGAKSRVLVIKSLAATSSAPYIGIMISGVPRVSRVRAADLVELEQAADSPGVFREISFEDRRVLIPELDQLNEFIEPVMTDS
jgi:chemosensory pili system protein ChpC